MARQARETVVQLPVITDVACVGGVRAYRLERDLDITAVRQLAEADIEDLQQIWSVGEVTAMRMKGSAQGHMNKYDEMVEEALEHQREEVFGDGPGSKTRRIVLVGFPSTSYQKEFDEGGDVTAEVEEGVAHQLISKALASLDIDPFEDNIALGWASNAQYPGMDESGGTLARSYYEELVGVRGDLLEKKSFPTDWQFYGGHPEYEAVDAIKSRNEAMIEWADDVVCFKPGKYEGAMEYAVGQHKEHTVRWHSPYTDDLELENAVDKVTDEDRTSSHRPKAEPLAQMERDEEAEAEWEEVDAEVGAYDRSEFTPHEDEDPTEHLHLWSDSLEQRPEVEETNPGGGAGSHDGWTDYSAGQ